VEVDEQTERAMREAQIREDLRGVDIAKRAYGLQFDHEPFINEQINVTFAYPAAFVHEMHGMLPYKGNIAQRQFHTQCFLVRRFEPPRPQLPMHLNCRPNYLVCKRINTRIRFHTRTIATMCASPAPSSSRIAGSTPFDDSRIHFPSRRLGVLASWRFDPFWQFDPPLRFNHFPLA